MLARRDSARVYPTAPNSEQERRERRTFHAEDMKSIGDAVQPVLSQQTGAEALASAATVAAAATAATAATAPLRTVAAAWAEAVVPAALTAVGLVAV